MVEDTWCPKAKAKGTRLSFENFRICWSFHFTGNAFCIGKGNLLPLRRRHSIPLLGFFFVKNTG